MKQQARFLRGVMPGGVWGAGGVILGALCLCNAGPVQAATFVVDTTSDSALGTCGAALGDCSFRSALNSANAAPGADTITFNIPGAGVQTIALTAALPAIGEALTIDGYTQPGATANTLAVGNDANLLIELNGTGANIVNAPLLKISAANSKVRGLIINRSKSRSIDLLGGGSTVEGCFIGTDAAGTADLGNGGGITITSSNNLIGGTTAAARNVIAGNGSIYAILINGGSNNTVQGCYIGTDKTGTVDLGNDGIGIQVSGSTQALIGGTTALARNVISGNGGNGVFLSPPPSTLANCVVQGNYIGTNATGTAIISNNGNGVQVNSNNNTVGGTTAGARNLLSGNLQNGLLINGGSNNVIQGNYIGTNAAGTAALGNKGIAGVLLNGNIGSNHDNLIGGSVAGAGNLISGNKDGIQINTGGTGNMVQGNSIGTDATGTGALGNARHGIDINSGANNIIGDTTTGNTPAAGNTIAFNNNDGIFIVSKGNTIRANSIHDNGELGIDLHVNGVTPNDADDPDSGANNLQNYPVIASVNGPNVSGSLNSSAGTTYRLDFYQSSSADPTGFGEGTTYLGSQSVTTGAASTTVTFTFTSPANISGVVTATATNTATGDTSEFSGAVAPTVLQLSINDISVLEGNSGTGSVNFTVTLSAAAIQPVKVDYATANGSAVAGGDYTAKTGTLTIQPGQDKGIISITIASDARDEINETFFVNLSNPVNAAITDGQGQGTIIDNDPTPTLSISDITITEGSGVDKNAVFNVTLSAPSGQTVSVGAIPANGTAKSPGDYTGGGQTLTFQPGEVSKPFSVPVLGDALDEDNETFFVLLSNPVNATVAHARATCTIADDDATPSITIEDVSIGEGHSGQRAMFFRLHLSAPSGRLVKVNYATVAGTATADTDYVSVPSTQTAFTTGQSVALVRVLINGDTLNEANETFKVNLTLPVNATIADNQGQGTILNDDSAPALSIDDVAVAEGNGGTKNLTFTVTLSKASGQAISVNYNTADGTAKAPGDYTAKTGTLSFAPSSALTRTIIIGLKGDTEVENDETLFVLLTGALNASVSKGRGIGTILNDDAVPVEAPSGSEG